MVRIEDENILLGFCRCAWREEVRREEEGDACKEDNGQAVLAVPVKHHDRIHESLTH
jgi:hypothetical protein